MADLQYAIKNSSNFSNWCKDKVKRDKNQSQINQKDIQEALSSVTMEDLVNALVNTLSKARVPVAAALAQQVFKNKLTFEQLSDILEAMTALATTLYSKEVAGSDTEEEAQAEPEVELCAVGEQASLIPPLSSSLSILVHPALVLFCEPFRLSRVGGFNPKITSQLQGLRRQLVALLDCVAARVLAPMQPNPEQRITIYDTSHLLLPSTHIDVESCGVAFLELYTLLLTKTTSVPDALLQPHLTAETNCDDLDVFCEISFVKNTHQHVLSYLLNLNGATSAVFERVSRILRLYSSLLYNYHHEDVIELCSALVPSLTTVLENDSLALGDVCVHQLLKAAGSVISNGAFQHISVQKLFEPLVIGSHRSLQPALEQLLKSLCAVPNPSNAATNAALSLLKAFLNCAFDVRLVYDRALTISVVVNVTKVCSDVKHLLQLGKTATALLYKSELKSDWQFLLPVLRKTCFRPLAKIGVARINETVEEDQEPVKTSALWPMSQLNADANRIAAHVFQTVALVQPALKSWTMMYWCGKADDVPVYALDRMCIGGLSPEYALAHLRRLHEFDESNILPFILNKLQQRIAATADKSPNSLRQALCSDPTVSYSLKRAVSRWVKERSSIDGDGVSADNDARDELVGFLADYIGYALECDHEPRYLTQRVREAMDSLFRGGQKRVVISICPGHFTADDDDDDDGDDDDGDDDDGVDDGNDDRNADSSGPEASPVLDAFGNNIIAPAGGSPGGNQPGAAGDGPHEVGLFIMEDSVTSAAIEHTLANAGIFGPQHDTKFWFHGCIGSKATKILNNGALEFMQQSTLHDLGSYRAFYCFEKLSLAKAHALHRRENDDKAITEEQFTPCVLIFDIPNALLETHDHLLVDSLKTWQALVYVSHNDTQRITSRKSKSTKVCKRDTEALSKVLCCFGKKPGGDLTESVELLKMHFSSPSWIFSWMAANPTAQLRDLTPKHETELPGVVSSDSGRQSTADEEASDDSLSLDPTDTWAAEKLTDQCSSCKDSCPSPVIGQLSLSINDRDLRLGFLRGLRAVIFLRRPQNDERVSCDSRGSGRQANQQRKKEDRKARQHQKLTARGSRGAAVAVTDDEEDDSDDA